MKKLVAFCLFSVLSVSTAFAETKDNAVDKSVIDCKTYKTLADTYGALKFPIETSFSKEIDNLKRQANLEYKVCILEREVAELKALLDKDTSSDK